MKLRLFKVCKELLMFIKIKQTRCIQYKLLSFKAILIFCWSIINIVL